jgi:hypothetical protein
MKPTQVHAVIREIRQRKLLVGINNPLVPPRERKRDFPTAATGESQQNKFARTTNQSTPGASMPRHESLNNKTSKPENEDASAVHAPTQDASDAYG